MSGELGEMKLELSKARGDMSASEAIKSQIESEVHDLSDQCKAYKKKIVDAREGAELVVQSHVNRYLKSDEFKGKVLEQSTCFYVMGFNDSLRMARESPAISLSTLRAVEYDSDSEEVQYGSDDRALPKVCPLTPQRTLARLATEFDQDTSQVGDDLPNPEVANARINPPLEGGTLANSTVMTANASKNTSEVELNLTSNLACLHPSTSGSFTIRNIVSNEKKITTSLTFFR